MEGDVRKRVTTRLRWYSGLLFIEITSTPRVLRRTVFLTPRSPLSFATQRTPSLFCLRVSASRCPGGPLREAQQQSNGPHLIGRRALLDSNKRVHHGIQVGRERVSQKRLQFFCRVVLLFFPLVLSRPSRRNPPTGGLTCRMGRAGTCRWRELVCACAVVSGTVHK